MAKTNELVHELQNQQNELNEELIQARAKIEAGIAHSTKLYDSLPVGCFTLGRDGTILQLNLAAAEILGSEQHEFTGKNLVDFIASKSLFSFKGLLNEAAASQNQEAREITFNQQGKPPLVAYVEATADGVTQQFHLMAINITEHKTSSVRMQKLSLLNDALSEISYKAEHKDSLEKIFRATCESCVTSGNFSLAWIGLADSEMLRITPIQISGPAARYLDDIDSRAGLDIQATSEPSTIAFSEQRVIICNDILANPYMEAWRDRAVANGLYSSIALPLSGDGKPYGTFTAYASETGFFDDESVRLFEKMADSVSDAITKSKQKEKQRLNNEKLRQSEEKFRTLVENLPLKIFIKDTNSQYISCNALFSRDLGIDPSQISGKSDYDFFPNEVASKYRMNDARIIESGKGIDLHEKYVHNGVERYSQIIKTPFKDAEGRIVGVVGASWDITARKQAERIKDHFAYEVEDLYQNAPCGYHSIDADGTITRINNTELNWLGYKREEVVDRLKASDLLTPESRQKFFEKLPLLMKSGELQDYEIEMVRKNGTILPVILSATAVYDEDGCYVSSRTMVCDISMRKELEREQAMHGKRLGELSHRLVAVQEEERRRLAGELHDRANPNLAAIRITLENLAASIPEELLARNRSYLDDIHAMLEDTTASIREICTELRPPLLDYAGLVPTLEGYAQQFMRRTGVAVSVGAQMNNQRLNKDVESLLFRIVQEAIANCAKHSSATNINIELANDWRHTVLMIKDDGIGFNPEILGNPGHVPGLGLITMRERAEFAGGKFSVISNPGAGTEIRVEFLNKDRRSGLSRRQQEYTANVRAASRTVDTTQSPDKFIERRISLSRRQQNFAAHTGNPFQAADPQPPHRNFIERRISMSRRQQDLTGNGSNSILSDVLTQPRANFIERRCSSRRQQDLAEHSISPAQAVAPSQHRRN